MSHGFSPDQDVYTLLCVRPDGVAPVVDLVGAEDLRHAQVRARALLSEHASCDTVEIWRAGALVETFVRS